jgi:hypothetical protein
MEFETFEWTTPPISSVLKLVTELFLMFNGQFARYRRFGVFGLHGLTQLWFYFWDLEMTYPPILKCSKSNDVKKIPYTITIWKIWGGLTFQSRVDFFCIFTEFEGLQGLYPLF